MRIASIMMGVVGGVVLLTCLLTVFFFPPDSMLFLGKFTVGLVMVMSAIILNWDGVKGAINKKGSAFIASSILSSAGVVCLLAALNYFSFTHKQEWDLTKDDLFTLSDQTQKVMQGMTQDVAITALFRKDEPEGMALEDLVNRYNLLSSHLRLQLASPDAHPDLVAKYKVTETSPRIILEASGRDGRLKEISEESLTNALSQLTTQEKKRLYFTQGHGEPKLDSTNESGIKASVDDLASEGFEAAALNLVESQVIPKDAAAIMVVAPSTPLFAPEAKLLGEYLDQGGKLILLAEPDTVTGLEPLLHAWRLELGKNTILDASQFGRLFGQGPDAAIVFEYSDHKAVSQLGGAASVFRSARSVTTLDGDAAIKATVLASSGARSWGETKVAQGDWQWNEGELRGPVPLAAIAEKDTSGVQSKVSNSARLVVVGDADVFSNQYRVLSSNRDFMLNTLAYVAEEENRITIRPKLRGASRIMLTPSQEMFIAFFALDGMPVTLLSLGLGIWLVRRRR